MNEKWVFTHYLLLITYYSLLITHYLLLITYYSLLITHYLLLITYYSLLLLKSAFTAVRMSIILNWHYIHFGLIILGQSLWRW
ncbi:hypothetical protein FBB35_06375 [Nostoc sp. TCL240-02]|nr:hypothetical protein FBB35_06375 [Nostoc sp. TCL240-02]